MFDRPGEKLKRLAVFDFIGVIIGSIILAFVFGITKTRYGSEFDFLKFLSILLGGFGGAYITALVFYAFGELVDSSERNADATYEMLRILQNSNLKSNASPNTNTPRPSTTHATSNGKAVVPSDFKMKALSDEKPEDWICTYCHTKNKAYELFCDRCSKYRVK